jgi:hypothetical protein
MSQHLSQFWITVQTGPGQTADQRITAPTLWSAGWLYRQLHPGSIVTMVRPIRQA